jgi:hypothetical protein
MNPKRLTEEKAIRIIELLASGGCYREIAQETGVCRSLVAQVATGKRFPDLPRPVKKAPKLEDPRVEHEIFLTASGLIRELPIDPMVACALSLLAPSDSRDLLNMVQRIV